MTILLNGERRDLPGPMSILALLERLHVNPRLVAVECNRVVVKRERYADTPVTDGAAVEIVAFVGGGAGPHRSPARRWSRTASMR
jgi:thiamine biosynthesis protein ThiS